MSSLRFDMEPVSVGMIVHYTLSAHDKDVQYAAIVTHVRDSEHVALCVFRPGEVFHIPDAPFSASYKPAYWSWPIRIV